MNEDLYSMSILSQFKFNTYIPFFGMSLSPTSLVRILNEIVINNRKNIVEFGSGISTIYMAKLSKINNLNLNIYSVDENSNWIRKVHHILVKENLDDAVAFIYSPLKFYNENIKWYDSLVLDYYFKNDYNCDMVLIDAPKASEKEDEEIRYWALPYMFNRLNYDHVIFLDDANREGEKNIIKKWSEEFNINFVIENNLAIYYNRKQEFYLNPIKLK